MIEETRLLLGEGVSSSCLSDINGISGDHEDVAIVVEWDQEAIRYYDSIHTFTKYLWWYYGNFIWPRESTGDVLS